MNLIKNESKHSIFKDLNFWILFHQMECNIDRDYFETLLKNLKAVFPFYENQHNSTIIEFKFHCGANYSIILECTFRYSVEWAESESELFIIETSTGIKHKMGWLDMARWHPLCIKPDEFDSLTKYWFINDPVWANTNYPTLLLKGYIGFSNELQVNGFKNRMKSHYMHLGIIATEMPPNNLLFIHFPKDENYKWVQHKELGWLYESDSYNCYSLRNECHSKGNEGTFPFKEYQDMMAFISQMQ